MGLIGGKTVAWSELWSAIGLDPRQDESLWKDLKLPLLLPPDVAPMLGMSVQTLNGWCRTDTLPAGFPPPICIGHRKKLWISLDILARREPEIYGDCAGKIRRFSPKRRIPERPNITLDPDLSITTLNKNSSVQADLANVRSIEPGTDGFMLADIEELIANISADEDNSPTAEAPMMDSVLKMLDAEIESGAPSSSRILTKTALRSLLRTEGKSPENTELSIALFDAWFPLGGWNRVTMPRISREVTSPTAIALVPRSHVHRVRLSERKLCATAASVSSGSPCAEISASRSVIDQNAI
jgi:predicted DNA-binding transcriptional regulator AlpA